MAFLKAGQSGVIIDENGNKIVDENGNGFSIGSGSFILRANHKILAKPEGGGDSVVIGGRSYRTVTIGTQTWLAENLDFKFPGCGIGDSGGSGEPTTPNAWYYNNDEATYGLDGVRKCGLLYNGYAVRYLEQNKSSLIPGWHIPTDDEWSVLANAVGYSVAGRELKALDNSITSDFPRNWHGNDTYGFGVLPAGTRHFSAFYNIGSFAGFWTTRTSGAYGYYRRYFTTEYPIYTNTLPLTDADSIRLVKDA